MPKKQWTTEEFIKKARKVHGERFDYSLVDYKYWNENIKIKCSIHGEFQQTPFNHLRSKGCKKCSFNTKEQTFKNILERFKNKHNNKYDYSQVEFVNYGRQVKIICPEHGEFKITPRSHLNGGGCAICNNEVVDLKSFIHRANLIHKNKFDYSKVDYQGQYEDVIIICPIHGEFSQKPENHYGKYGCSKCSLDATKIRLTKDTEFFITKSLKIHGDKYDYSLTEYVNNNSPVSIICSIHGTFKQRPYNHLSGRGCDKCARMKSIGVYKYSNWEKAALRSKFFDSYKIYILKCWNEEETFYKIGRTFNTVKKRFGGKSSMPYNYEVLKIFESQDYKIICDLEIKLLSLNKMNKYLPKLEFGGRYECFARLSPKNIVTDDNFP